MVEQFLAILIIVPTAAVLAMGVLYILGAIVAGAVSGIGELVTVVRHGLHFHGTPALHH